MNVHMPQGKGAVLASFLAFFGICICIVSICDMMLRNAFDSCVNVTRGPRTLKYYGNPQILDGKLEVQVGRVRTLSDAPVDVGRPRIP